MSSEELLFKTLRPLHLDNPLMRCGARARREVHHYNSKVQYEHDLVCTEPPGHDGDHKDAICCWKFHTFPDAEPSPEDVWEGKLCTCGKMDCETRAALDEWEIRHAV